MSDAGEVTRFVMTSRLATAPDTAPPILERESSVRDTVITTVVRRNGVVDTAASKTTGVPRRGAVPWVQSGTALLEQAVRQLLASRVDSVEVPQYTFGVNQAFPSYVRRRGGDTVELFLGNFAAPMYARVGRGGEVRSLSARATTVKTETVHVPRLDYDAVVRGWAAAERSGLAVGPVSGRDTARARLAGSELWVDYGRPARRGRAIFGALVPWDSVWRTGANAATQFHTDVEVTVGGANVPPGTYSLWTIPTPRGATLIINRQAGQWGTQYDPAKDLARVPMRVDTAAPAVDRLTISLDPEPNGARLTVAWDTRRLSVPVAPRAATGG